MNRVAKTLFLVIVLAVSREAIALEGNFSATVLALDIDSRIVSSWLPCGATLKNPHCCNHKVILMMGTQRNVSFLRPYEEVIVVVPDVQYRGCTYMYFPKLYLNNKRAVRGGRIFFGFPKIHAWMCHTANQFKLCLKGVPLLNAKLRHHLNRPISRGENFAEMKRMLSQPMLLVQRRKVVCSKFVMQLDREHITNVEVERLDVCKGFMPGLPSFSTPVGCNDACPGGAFYIHNAHWCVPKKATCCP